MIADVNYYTSLGFETRSESPERIEQALMRAERLIDLVTAGKCREFSALHEEQQKQLKYAISAQAERYLINGFHDGEDAIDCKVKLGDFSYESRAGGVVTGLSPLAQTALKVSGLLYAGGEVR